jgi:hypothetical protein
MTAEVHASLRGSTPSREHLDQLGLLLLVEQRAGAGLGAGMRKLDIAYDENHIVEHHSLPDLRRRMMRRLCMACACEVAEPNSVRCTECQPPPPLTAAQAQRQQRVHPDAAQRLAPPSTRKTMSCPAMA